MTRRRFTSALELAAFPGHEHHAPLTVDTLLSHQVLGTQALYRVIDPAATLVAVEVLDAPGLAAGLRLKLTRKATSAMRVLTADTARVPSPATAPSRRLAASPAGL